MAGALSGNRFRFHSLPEIKPTERIAEEIVQVPVEALLKKTTQMATATEGRSGNEHHQYNLEGVECLEKLKSALISALAPNDSPGTTPS